MFVDIWLTGCLNTDPHSPKETASENTLLPLELLTQTKLQQNFQLAALEVPGDTKNVSPDSSGCTWSCMKQAGYSWQITLHTHVWQVPGCESTAHLPSYLADQGVPLFKRHKKRKINRNKSLVCYLQTTNQIYTMRKTLKIETYKNMWNRGKQIFYEL